MTTLDKGTQIPSAINTVERLAAWSALVLTRINPTKSAQEIPNVTPEKTAQITILKGDDGVYRLICRLSLPLADDYVTDNSVKFWQKVNDLENAPIPADFTTD